MSKQFPEFNAAAYKAYVNPCISYEEIGRRVIVEKHLELAVSHQSTTCDIGEGFFSDSTVKWLRGKGFIVRENEEVYCVSWN